MPVKSNDIDVLRRIFAAPKFFLPLIVLMSLAMSAHSQMKECAECAVPSFQSITLYYIAQPGSDVGFGFEAGKWNRDDSRFSYFLGAKMQWFNTNPYSNKFNNSADNMRFSAYIKGQARLLNSLYFVVTPQFVNLNAFELGLGFRYTYPLSEVIGVGIEPTFSIIQKEYLMNANIHFAL